MAKLRGLRRDPSGATAVEFALIAPIVFALTFAIIEFGLILFEYHTVGEAARFGTREILIANPLADLSNLNNSDSTCTGTSDTQVTCTSGNSSDANATFAAIVSRMQAKAPKLKGTNLTITYSDSEVTDPSAGSPTPGLITPMISVSVQNYQYDYIILGFVPGVPTTMTLPTFTTTRQGHTLNSSS